MVELARGADILIHEATGATEVEGKANEYGHTSARQAAAIAKKAGVGKLLLTHISPRYEDWTPLLKEAWDVFPATELADDFKTFDVPFREE